VTLGRRVVLASSAALLAVVVLLSVFAYFLVKHELYSRFDLTLEGRGAELAPAVRAGSSGFRSIVAAPGELVQSLSAQGATARPPYQITQLPSGRPQRAVAAGSGALTETITARGARMRLLTVHIGPKQALQIARPLEDDDATLRRLRLVLGVVAVCAVLLSVMLGGWIAEKALAPVRRLTRTAEGVARTRDLSVRLDEEGHDEVSRLGAAFNEMLVALDRSLTAQRRLVADASHEFRTPLTSIRANAELLERGRVREDERNAVARAVVEQVDELDGLVTDLIELALDGEAATRFEDVRLDEIVSTEVERMRRHAAGVDFQLVAQPCVVRGDPERLGRAVANVLANAVKWSPDRATVEVTVDRGTVVVRDHGPGIEEADLPLVFERFYRSPSARGTTGSGLGLAIVRHVLEAHGGSVTAGNAADGGAVFTLRFPVPDA
jgi:two-component system sensor histidine kinase MprB